jgi:RsiW-degrading membrane proteinase PrsW (M82 family)
MAFVVEEGLERGRVIPLPVGRGTLGGDRRNAHVALRDPHLAPTHLAVDVQPDGQVTVWPVGGPAWINDAPIDGAVQVPPGARVRIGQTTLRLGAMQPAAFTPLPARPPAADRKKSSAGLVAGWIVMGLIGLVILIGVFGSYGAQAAASLLAAALPAPLLVGIVLLIDRYEPEPKPVLAITYLYGATAAVLLAGLLTALVPAMLGISVTQFTEVSVVAPIVEESLKSLAVLAVFWRLRDQFNGVVDAVVYSAMVGLGFAVTENVLYYGMTLVEGTDVFAVTFVLRGVFSPFAHPLFTSMFGVGLVLAAETARARALWPILGWLMSVLLHGLWNAGASTDAFILVYVLFFVPVFAVVLTAAILASRREQRLIRSHLAGDVASGLLTPDELDNIASIRRRRAAERESARVGGTAARDRRREFHTAATRLAFTRHRRKSGALHAATAEQEAHQVAEVSRAKAATMAWVR